MASKKFCLFVGRIPWTVSGDVLREYFSRYGNVNNAIVKFDRETGFSKGYGFVTFSNREAFRAALNQPSHEIDGTTVVVQTGDQSKRSDYDS